MPVGAWSMTCSSMQWFPPLKPELKLQSPFSPTLYTSLPLPWKHTVLSSYSKLLLWAPDLLCLEMAHILFPEFPLPEWGLVSGKNYGGVQSRMVTATSVTLNKFLQPPVWAGTLINNYSISQLWILGQNLLQHPLPQCRPSKIIQNYVI